MPITKLITSAAYVNQELAAEFGKLPPAFLPLGLSRLYEAQAAALGEGPIFLSLPETFAPFPSDLNRLEKLNIIPIGVPEGITLGSSVSYTLSVIAAPNSPLLLLHGDTLIEDVFVFMSGENKIAVHNDFDGYSWAAVDAEDGRVIRLKEIDASFQLEDLTAVVCGLFSFDSSSALLRAITRARGDFVQGLTLYADEAKVQPVTLTNWHDFGHLQTYFKSRRNITTARAFNTLKISAKSVRKSSVDRGKMRAEAHWLRSLPAVVLPYSARLLSFEESVAETAYETEYAYAPTLSELFVFSSLGKSSWQHILASCEDFLDLCASIKSPENESDTLKCLVTLKTASRLEMYAEAGEIPIDCELSYNGRRYPSLVRINQCISEIIESAAVKQSTIMHGDFCFSNILYNSRSGRIAVIDPRGFVRSGQPSIFGDLRYDLAKLAHSIDGRYDHIMAGRYALQHDGNDFVLCFEDEGQGKWLTSALNSLVVDGVSAGSVVVQAINVSLFLSMLPLHADRPDRQQAFVANALRLYSGLEKRL